MAQRRARPRTCGQHRGDAGQDANVEVVPAGGSSSTRSKIAAAIANTPGSPEETTTTRPRLRHLQRVERPVALDPVVAGMAGQAGPLGHPRDIGI